MRKKYIIITVLGLVHQLFFAQVSSPDFIDFVKQNNTNLKINTKHSSNFGNFSVRLNQNNSSREERLADISFGYTIRAALTASALIKQAREKSLNQWFDRQHTVLKNEIERQLGQSFLSYNEARNTYFKYYEKIALQRNYSSVAHKYHVRQLEKQNKQTIALKKLKLLRLRENELKSGSVSNSLYGKFKHNGKSLSEIQNIQELHHMRSIELRSFSENNWSYQNDRFLYNTAKNLGNLKNYEHAIFTELLNKQQANYNKYDRWQQIDLLQAYLNKIQIPLALPSNYTSPKTFATSVFIENYMLNHLARNPVPNNIFHPNYYRTTSIYHTALATERRSEAISDAMEYVEELRAIELDRLLNEGCAGGRILNAVLSICECPDDKVENSSNVCIDNCTEFDLVINKVLNLEGGFVDDPADPGGATNKGISWLVWKENATRVLGLEPTILNLQSLTDGQAKKIYKKLYWDSIYADDISDGDLRYMLFDFYVNAGNNAIKVLQKTLNQLGSNLSVDGSIGVQTINTINNFDSQISLYNTFKANRKSYYNSITQNSINKYITKHPSASDAEIKLKTFKRFINGWINRVNHFLDKTSTNYLYVNC